jgi:hypothetical protein
MPEQLTVDEYAKWGDELAAEVADFASEPSHPLREESALVKKMVCPETQADITYKLY